MNRSLLLLVALCIATDALAQGLVLKYSGRISRDFGPDLGFLYRPEWSDFDGNGWPDRIVQNQADNLVTVYGFPGLAPLWTSPMIMRWGGYFPFFLDVTGDNVKEVFYMPNTGEQALAVFSTTSNACIFYVDSLNGDHGPLFLSDYDGDGVVDISVVIHDPTAADDRHEIWGAGTVVSSPPSHLVIVPQDQTLVLRWDPVDSCSAYEIQWSFPSDTAWAPVGTSCLPYFEHPGAAIVPKAYYRVVAITATSDPRIIGPTTYSESEGQRRR